MYRGPVKSQQQTPLLPIDRRGFSDRGPRRSMKTQTDSRSSNCVRITASSVPLGLRVLDRKPGIRQLRAPIEFPRTTGVGKRLVPTTPSDTTRSIRTCSRVQGDWPDIVGAHGRSRGPHLRRVDPPEAQRNGCDEGDRFALHTAPLLRLADDFSNLAICVVNQPSALTITDEFECGSQDADRVRKRGQLFPSCFAHET